MACLSDPLQKCAINPTTRDEIISRFWGPNALTDLENDVLDCEAYFTYYKSQCRHALHDRGRHISAQSHGDLLRTATYLERPLTKEVIRQILSRNVPVSDSANEGDALDNSIDLTARLFVMMNIGALKYGLCGGRTLVWTHGSLKDFVHEHFDGCPAPGDQNIKLEKIFNAHNLDRIAGVQIEWTNDLAEHLRMTDNEAKVVVFHHASFLKSHQSSIFPDGLVEETLRTLALLFPQSDKATQKWFKGMTLSQQVDKKVVRCGSLKADDRQITKFKFWQHRLVVLKQVFDESRPKTPSQWWYDTRNGVQWYTFWVAFAVLFLTALFGLTQSIEGALQVYKAYHPVS